jgi:hypothetical protein
MHKFVVKFCTNWLPVGQRQPNTEIPTIIVPYADNMNRSITFSVANPAARGESLFFAHSTSELKKWLTAAGIRREIVTGLTQ